MLAMMPGAEDQEHVTDQLLDMSWAPHTQHALLVCIAGNRTQVGCCTCQAGGHTNYCIILRGESDHDLVALVCKADAILHG